MAVNVTFAIDENGLVGSGLGDERWARHLPSGRSRVNVLDIGRGQGPGIKTQLINRAVEDPRLFVLEPKVAPMPTRATPTLMAMGGFVRSRTLTALT